MEEKSAELISQYELTINNCYRSRGCLYLDTPSGLLQLRSYTGSESRQHFEAQLKKHIQDSGYDRLDFSVTNREGNYISLNQYSEKFVLRKWYPCDECSFTDTNHIRMAAQNLAALHNCMTCFIPEAISPLLYTQTPVTSLFAKRNRELKRVRGYIRGKKKRNEFENTFLQICDDFMANADRSALLLDSFDTNSMYSEALDNGSLCHGNYTSHNILILADKKAATSGFDKAEFGIQLTDLYLLIRKVMEKNRWDISLGIMIITEYSNIRSLSARDMEFLYILLLYPEKFWKITNNYYNNKKSWVPGKNLQKLTVLNDSIEMKQIFLNEMKHLYLSSV